MRLIVTNPALKEAFERQGKDWETFWRTEMRTVVCANCHVEYYFKGDGKYSPSRGTIATIVEILSYYEEAGFKRLRYMQKLKPPCLGQHPEYEFFTAGSTHYNAGRFLRRLSYAIHKQQRRKILFTRCA